jgi:hypothetical protein
VENGFLDTGRQENGSQDIGKELDQKGTAGYQDTVDQEDDGFLVIGNRYTIVNKGVFHE